MLAISAGFSKGPHSTSPDHSSQPPHTLGLDDLGSGMDWPQQRQIFGCIILPFVCRPSAECVPLTSGAHGARRVFFIAAGPPVLWKNSCALRNGGRRPPPVTWAWALRCFHGRPQGPGPGVGRGGAAADSASSRGARCRSPGHRTGAKFLPSRASHQSAG